MLSIYVFSYFPFGFEGKIWDLIVSVPDHCLSFYFILIIFTIFIILSKALVFPLGLIVPILLHICFCVVTKTTSRYLDLRNII